MKKISCINRNYEFCTFPIFLFKYLRQFKMLSQIDCRAARRALERRANGWSFNFGHEWYIQSGPSMMSWVDPHSFNQVDPHPFKRVDSKGVDRLRTSLTVRTVRIPGWLIWQSTWKLHIFYPIASQNYLNSRL